jgi:hypothetical protein
MLAFHGDHGKIRMPEHHFVSLESLATMMGRRFAGRLVHFASYSTAKIDNRRLARFMKTFP